jgi:DNA-binding MarR family transcriptional regulator
MIDAGLTVTQFEVMETLYSLGPPSQREIDCKILKSTGTLHR